MKITCHSSEVFDQGYAVPVYCILTNTRIWRHRSEEITIPTYAVPVTEYKGWPVAKWDDVKRAHQERTA